GGTRNRSSRRRKFRGAGGPRLPTAAERRRPPVIGPGHTFATVTDKISTIVLTRPTTPGWLAGFLVSFSLMMLLFYAIGYLLLEGDRKSTRLNSSHGSISYAVFCLKKKKG